MVLLLVSAVLTLGKYSAAVVVVIAVVVAVAVGAVSVDAAVDADVVVITVAAAAEDELEFDEALSGCGIKFTKSSATPRAHTNRFSCDVSLTSTARHPTDCAVWQRRTASMHER